MLARALRACVGGAVAVLGCAAVVAAAGPEITPGKVSRLTFKAGAQELSYYIFVPKNLAAPASAPLLVLFHGSGRNGSTLVEPWKKLAEKEGIVLVAPNAQDPQQWQEPLDGPALVCSLIDELRQALPVIDARRVYMFGHSAGAVFALNMAMLESEYFAAAAVHAGAYRSRGEFDILDAATRQIPVAITVGDSDRFFSLDGRERHRGRAEEGIHPGEAGDHQEPRSQLLHDLRQGERLGMVRSEGPAPGRRPEIHPPRLPVAAAERCCDRPRAASR